MVSPHCPAQRIVPYHKYYFYHDYRTNQPTMVSLSRYWSSQFSEEVDDAPVAPVPGVSKTGDEKRSMDTENNPAKRKKTATKKIDGLSLPQHRRMLGDLVRDKIQIAGGQGNWHIKALCHVTTQMSMETFQAVVVPDAACLTPQHMDSSTEVL